jgi:hypothetical protein
MMENKIGRGQKKDGIRKEGRKKEILKFKYGV